MKKSKLLWGSIGVAAIATAVVVSPIMNDETPVASYVPSTVSETVFKGAHGQKEFYNYWHTNHETGELWGKEDLIRQSEEMAQIRQNRSTLLSWKEMGPSNIGGRTRAICIDKNDRFHLLAGSVTGGLWQSFDAANTWSKVEGYNGDYNIKTIAQSNSGKFYVGTGMQGVGESALGDGIHVSSDNGTTWSVLSGSESFGSVMEIVSDDVSQNLWIAEFDNGLYKYTEGGTLQLIPGTENGVSALEVSADGQVIVIGVNSFGRKTMVSKDGGNTFVDYTDNANTSSPIESNGFSRVEYSISKTKSNGEYYVYAIFSNTNGDFGGAWVSKNSGSSWTEIAPNVGPAQVGQPEVFNPVNGGSNPQGVYNLVVASTPWDPTGCFIGGIDVHRWKQQLDNPIFGDFKQVSQWFVDPTSSSYVHADNHEIVFDVYNRMYIGNDGGIGVCDAVWPFFESGFGLEFFPANRNYNVTQFYDISFSGHGDIIGGTQDNGTLYNDHTNHDYRDFVEVLGGDGFYCDISAFNRNTMFGSSQYGNVNRSNDGGESWSAFLPTLSPNVYGVPGGQGGLFPFVTQLRLGEYYDTDSEDSVTFAPLASFSAGDIVKVPSLASGDTIEVVAPTDILFQDTVYYNPSIDVTQYVVRDSITGTNLYDLAITNYSTAIFPGTSNLNPPVVGDSIELISETGTNDTIVVAEVMPYDFHYASHPTDGRTIALHRDTIGFSVSWDTLRVQDPYQSWFFFYTLNNGGEIWATREAIRFSAANPKWGRIMTGVGSLNQVTFSKTLDRVYIASSAGLNVITGLDSIYSQQSDFLTRFDLDSGAIATTITTIASGNIGSCAIDYTNPDHIVYAPVGGGNIRESFNAMSGSPTFSNISGFSSIAYDVEIVQDVSVGGTAGTLILAGTEEGLIVHDGSSWADCSDGFGPTEVRTIKYAYRTWDEGNHFYGGIYVGTYGRGSWRSDSFLSLPDEADYPTFNEGVKTDLTVFPNPVVDQANLGFVLPSDEDVKIEVYSLSGRLVKTMPKKHMQKGQNQLTLNIDDLNAGTYIVKMTAGTHSDVTKFIKSK